MRHGSIYGPRSGTVANFRCPFQRVAGGAKVIDHQHRAPFHRANQGLPGHYTLCTALFEEGQLDLSTQASLEQFAEDLRPLDTSDVRRGDAQLRIRQARREVIHHQG